MQTAATLKRLATNAGALAVGGVLAQAAFVFIEASIARRIGVASYGVFSLVYTVTLALVILVDMGMNWKLIQDGSRNAESIGHNLKLSFALKTLFFFLTFPLVLGLLAWAPVPSGSATFFAAFAAFGLLLTLQDSLAAVFSAHQRNYLNAAFQTAMPVLILGAALVLLARSPTLSQAAVAYVLGAAMTLAAWLIFTLRRYPTLKESIRTRISVAGSIEMLRGSYQYALTSLMQHFGLRTGIVLLAVLRSPHEVALFAAAFKLLELGYKAPVLAMRVVAPKLYADRVHAPKLFASWAGVFMQGAGVLSSITAFILIVGGPDIVVLIFGSNFSEAAPLAQLLGIALALKTLSLMAETVLTTADDIRFRSQAIALSLGFTVCVSIPLILKWGAPGAAAGVIAGDCVMLMLVLSRLKRLLPESAIASLILIPLAALICAVAVIGGLHLGVLAELTIGAVVLISILLVTGYVTRLRGQLRELQALDAKVG